MCQASGSGPSLNPGLLNPGLLGLDFTIQAISSALDVNHFCAGYEIIAVPKDVILHMFVRLETNFSSKIFALLLLTF